MHWTWGLVRSPHWTADGMIDGSTGAKFDVAGGRIFRPDIHMRNGGRRLHALHMCLHGYRHAFWTEGHEFRVR